MVELLDKTAQKLPILRGCGEYRRIPPLVVRVLSEKPRVRRSRL
jgi:hypothetical protein